MDTRNETMKRKTVKRCFLFFLALTIALPMGLAQKKDKNEYRLSDKDLANVVYVMGQMYPEGFTLDLNTMRQPSAGLMVSYKETQSSFSRKSIREVIKHAHAHENIVGGWYDPDKGDYYFSPKTTLPLPSPLLAKTPSKLSIPMRLASASSPTMSRKTSVSSTTATWAARPTICSL